jgi:hypothetical protein
VAAIALRLPTQSDTWIVAGHLGVVAFVLLVTASLTHTVWREREVTADTILGGVALTTLGYGDLVPASVPAAGLASLQAMVGPRYLTILIARLVGLHIAGGRPAAGGSERPG